MSLMPSRRALIIAVGATVSVAAVARWRASRRRAAEQAARDPQAYVAPPAPSAPRESVAAAWTPQVDESPLTGAAPAAAPDLETEVLVDAQQPVITAVVVSPASYDAPVAGVEMTWDDPTSGPATAAADASDGAVEPAVEAEAATDVEPDVDVEPTAEVDATADVAFTADDTPIADTDPGADVASEGAPAPAADAEQPAAAPTDWDAEPGADVVVEWASDPGTGAAEWAARPVAHAGSALDLELAGDLQTDDDAMRDSAFLEAAARDAESARALAAKVIPDLPEPDPARAAAAVRKAQQRKSWFTEGEPSVAIRMLTGPLADE